MQANTVFGDVHEQTVKDLGSLAWVLEEVHKSLDGATKAVRRFVRDAEQGRGTALESLDASPLRDARQQLHQAVGALEMVGQEAPARVLHAMEALAGKFVQHPEFCSEEAAVKVEKASFALTEYLEGVLRGRVSSPVALFPQYRDVMALLGADRIHPSDLWPIEWRWLDAHLPPRPALADYSPAVRAKIDSAMLTLIKSGDVSSAQTLRDLSLNLAAGQKLLESRVFWKICAAFFEAISCHLCPVDVYVKRTASRVVSQYASLAKGEKDVSDRLAQDMLFFCSQAVPADQASAPILSAYRAAYGLSQSIGVDYAAVQFGRVDPALLLQLRKRIVTATETWAALSGGDTHRMKVVAEQFNTVCDSLLKLQPENGDIARALLQAVEATVRSGVPPSTPVAMEVATAILYLDAAFEDPEPTAAKMTERSSRLAHRLEKVSAGGPSEPLEGWMEELYRRVSDRQTMGSVVGELRTNLAEVEKSLDLFLRNPQDKQPLKNVPSQLTQMRGVFTVLGLDQAALATLHMRESVDQILVNGGAPTNQSQPLVFEKLSNSLSALGFLIDMLSYQRQLAKKLFVYDDVLGEFKPLMGRQKEQVATPAPARVPSSAAVSVQPESFALPAAPVVSLTAPAVKGPGDDEKEAERLELRDIFLEEVREVVGNGLEAVAALEVDPMAITEQTTLRRAWHTLKGSARMVDLTEFGEAAWAMEQLLNHWLAEHKPASPPLLHVSRDALKGMGRWADAIALDQEGAWKAAPFRCVADGLRLENKVVALDLPGASAQAVQEPLAPLAPLVPLTPTVPLVLPPSLVAATVPVEVPKAPEVVQVEEVVAFQQAMEAEAQAQAEAEPQRSIEEQYKVIGTLRIGIPLYNVYLNEADEWSRRLQTELGEWALELHHPLSDSCVALAHSLGGSSATVGFMALSKMARSLEQALEHVQRHAPGQPQHAQVFVAAADHIRHLLHQFAAGFLKEPDTELLQSLDEILATEFAVSDYWANVVQESESVQAEPTQVAPAPRSAAFGLGLVPKPTVQAPQVSAHHALAGAAQIIIEGQDEDIDAIDNVDRDLFPIFEEEADELLPKLSGALRRWAVRPDDLGARAEVLRVLHTLKGSARLAGAMRLGEMSHHMESAIEKMSGDYVQSQQVEPLLARLDALQQDFDGLRASVAAAEAVVPPAPVSASMPASVTALGQVPVQVNQIQPVVVVNAPAAVSLAPRLAQPTLHTPSRQTAGHFVRVRSQLLDRLLNQAGEVMITRSKLDTRLGQIKANLKDLTGNLDRLRQQLRDIELQAETQMQSRLALTKDTAQGFDPLEFDRFTQVQELTRMMAESVNDVATVQRNLQATIGGAEDDLIAQARQARELQRDLLRTRMVEFESISERLYAVVRQAAKEADKQVKLDITGGSIEMDRGVLDRMAPAFEHMLRNAVAHGVEDAAARKRAGKTGAGTISINLHHEGNDVSVTFSDDGAGLDLNRIRDKALASGVVPAGATLTDAEAAQLIFTSGFSTASKVTELAGRGIGMDVVRTDVNALGGRIETTTTLGAGVHFKLVLPLTTAVTQVVMLRMGQLSVGVPANLVEIVRRITVPELEQAYQSGQLAYAGDTLPFYWAGALLQTSSRSVESTGKTQAVVIFRSAGQRLAVHVDEVLGNQEVVVKNLGPQLSRLPGLAGMSVLASGAVVLIYNPVALASIYGDKARDFQRATPPAQGGAAGQTGNAETIAFMAAPNALPLVLVVDDSITVRRVTQRLLKRAGYRVSLAADGLQALQMLQTERPDLVLSDIEMPRMDGFELARHIRADAKLHDLPIIMITSRMAEKHREHARELGVNHYLGKPYAEDELLNLVQRYTRSEMPA